MADNINSEVDIDESSDTGFVPSTTGHSPPLMAQTVAGTPSDNKTDARWIPTDARSPKPVSVPPPPKDRARVSTSDRSKCVILFNLPESSESTAKGRLDADLAELQRTIQLLLVDGDQPITVQQLFRLGAPNTEGKPRPLKVVLGDTNDANFLVRRSYRLRNTQISLRPDLSPEDRLRRKSALTELRSRTQQGETDLMIVNFRVVRRRALLHQAITLSWAPPVILHH